MTHPSTADCNCFIARSRASSACRLSPFAEPSIAATKYSRCSDFCRASKIHCEPQAALTHETKEKFGLLRVDVLEGDGWRRVKV